MGFTRSCVKYDTDAGTLSVASKEVLEVTVKGYVLMLSWCDCQWEEWQDFQNSSEFAALKKVGQDRLDQAKAGQQKGKGKGPAPA